MSFVFRFEEANRVLTNALVVVFTPSRSGANVDKLIKSFLFAGG
jgi:hypothetical protein